MCWPRRRVALTSSSPLLSIVFSFRFYLAVSLQTCMKRTVSGLRTKWYYQRPLCWNTLFLLLIKRYKRKLDVLTNLWLLLLKFDVLANIDARLYRLGGERSYSLLCFILPYYHWCTIIDMMEVFPSIFPPFF